MVNTIADTTVFTAVRFRALVGNNGYVPWELVTLDTAGGFDSSKSIYTVPHSGIYLTHFSAGVPPFSPAIVTLQGSTNSPNILKTEDGYNGEMMVSRDDIQWWSKGQQLYLSSNYTLTSDGMFQTSWSAVRIDDIMAPVEAFSLARTSDFSSTSLTPLPFTNTMLTVGNALTACNHQFVAPTYGTYFITFSVGMEAYSTVSIVRIYLRVDGSTRSMAYADNPLASSNDKDISSNSVLLKLSAGDLVDLQFAASYNYDHYSDSHYQTSLSGFLYEPVHGYNVAWSVAQSNTNTYTGPVTAFPFNQVWVNDGGVWSTSTNTATISVSGIYWLKVSGTSPSSTTNQFNFIITLNGQPLINAMEKVTNGGYNVRSHSVAYRLSRGDQLQVSLPNGFQVYTLSYTASFCGFLIYPDF